MNKASYRTYLLGLTELKTWDHGQHTELVDNFLQRGLVAIGFMAVDLYGSANSHEKGLTRLKELCKEIEKHPLIRPSCDKFALWAKELAPEKDMNRRDQLRDMMRENLKCAGDVASLILEIFRHLPREHAFLNAGMMVGSISGNPTDLFNVEDPFKDAGQNPT